MSRATQYNWKKLVSSAVFVISVCVFLFKIVFGSLLSEQGKRNYLHMKETANASASADLDAAISSGVPKFRGIISRDRLTVRWVDIRCLGDDPMGAIVVHDFSEVPIDSYLRRKVMSAAKEYVSDYNYTLRRHLEKMGHYNCQFIGWEGSNVIDSRAVEKL